MLSTLKSRPGWGNDMETIAVGPALNSKATVGPTPDLGAIFFADDYGSWILMGR